MTTPLEVYYRDEGDELYFEGKLWNVGDWYAGASEEEIEIARIHDEAKTISHCLAPLDTVERQLAMAVLMGEERFARALADKIVNGE